MEFINTHNHHIDTVDGYRSGIGWWRRKTGRHRIILRSPGTGSFGEVAFSSPVIWKSGRIPVVLIYWLHLWLMLMRGWVLNTSWPPDYPLIPTSHITLIPLKKGFPLNLLLRISYGYQTNDILIWGWSIGINLNESPFKRAFVIDIIKGNVKSQLERWSYGRTLFKVRVQLQKSLMNDKSIDYNQKTTKIIILVDLMIMK